jgi:polyhydroxyalkanoate synthesis repressor PhaR
MVAEVIAAFAIVPGGLSMAETASAGTASETAAPDATPVTIKKYANRRLYNTATSSYITLEHLCQMVKDGIDFVVLDAKTGDDITRQILTQIIVEEEGKGQNLLPISFMRKLIGFYGDNMQWALPTYLDQSMQSFASNQERMREYFSKTVGGVFPFDAITQMGKQNLSLMEQAVKMFTLSAAPPGEGESAEAPSPAEDIKDLRRRLEELEREIGGIGKPPKA